MDLAGLAHAARPEHRTVQPLWCPPRRATHRHSTDRHSVHAIRRAGRLRMLCSTHSRIGRAPSSWCSPVPALRHPFTASCRGLGPSASS